MKEYKIKILFDVEQIITDLKELVQNDYNTTKLNFTFDKEGRVLFKMSYPDGTQYVDDIKNNELIFGKGVLNQEGTYEYEIALYTEDGRLTNHAIGKFEVRSELVNTDEIVEADDRVPVLDTLINDVTAIKTSAENGEFDGEDGITPTIGENGNWFIGDTDTGLPSRGEQGKQGEAGGVTLEEVTAITGDTQELETESKQLVGAINEVLNNSGGSGSSVPSLYVESVGSGWSMKQEYYPFFADAINNMVKNDCPSPIYIQCNTSAWNGVFVPVTTIRVDVPFIQFGTSPISTNSGHRINGFFTVNLRWKDGVCSVSSMTTPYTETIDLSKTVTTNSTQTISGKKTFTTLPETSVTPTTDNQMVNKKYVDTAIANAITTTLEGSY